MSQRGVMSGRCNSCDVACVLWLQTAGVVFSISIAILGLTLLAWGNSIGGLSSLAGLAAQSSSLKQHC